MKKVNIALKEKVHLQAKVIAVVKGINLSEYLERAIEDAINRDKKLIETLSVTEPKIESKEKEGEKK